MARITRRRLLKLSASGAVTAQHWLSFSANLTALATGRVGLIGVRAAFSIERTWLEPIFVLWTLLMSALLLFASLILELRGAAWGYAVLTSYRVRITPGLFNALYMNLIDCSAAMPPIARLYRVLATFSARLKRRMLAANERILAKTPGFLRIREASSAKLPSRT